VTLILIRLTTYSISYLLYLLDRLTT
jgi:hypothetical protein